MMRLAAILGFALLIGTGCAHRRERHDRPVQTVAEARPAELASTLLFDPRPGRFDAQEFAQRSDWPSTIGFYSPGEVIYYSERFVDYQGRGWGALGNSLGAYRRADSYRVGVGYR